MTDKSKTFESEFTGIVQQVKMLKAKVAVCDVRPATMTRMSAMVLLDELIEIMQDNVAETE